MVESLGTLFKFIGGLGMFLYGMNVMADGLQKSAGNKMKRLLGYLTNNRILAILVGALVTAIIQSSSATTVMVVGFVNAGLLSLIQAVGVIMGANIGTTITSWLVSLNELGSMLKPEFYAPLFIGIGAFAIMFAKGEKKKEIGEILVGFGILFIGLNFMSGAIKPYANSPIFSKAFQVLGSNPILGILVGTVVTAILQSSSASVGILQTLALNGVVTWNSAVYITLGQNIGTCVTAIISSAGANKTAKRAAMIHLLFNVAGAIIFGIAMFLIFNFNRVFASSSISSVQISIFHTIFNVSNTILLFPAANLLVKLSGVFIKDNDQDENNEDEIILRHLDERLLETPSFAIENAKKVVLVLGESALSNTKLSMESLLSGNRSQIDEVIRKEEVIDRHTKLITDYLVKINNLSLNEKQHLVINNLFNTVSNIERVADHAENIAELAEERINNDLEFSDQAKAELKQIGDAAIKSFENSIHARRHEKMEYINNVLQCEELVDSLEENFRNRHIDRLSKNLCDSEIGIIFIDSLVNLERISDHSLNIAGYVKDELN